MSEHAHTPIKGTCEGFDYSTPEAQQALTDVLDVVLEIRDDLDSPMTRRVALYERTLGLAVIPVLLGRVVRSATRKARD
jgi:hypothetical protein